LWVDEDTAITYTYYFDGDSYQWVEFGPEIGGPLTTFIGNPNQVIYKNSNNEAISSDGFVFDGTNVGIGSTQPTATLDVNGTLNVSGVSTFQNNVHLLDNDRFRIGGSVGTFDGFELFHIGNNSYISDSGSGFLAVLSNQFKIRNAFDNEDIAIFNENGSVELYYDNSKKFETTGIGATVFGTLETQQLNVSGVSTFRNNVDIEGVNSILDVEGKIYTGVIVGNSRELYIRGGGEQTTRPTIHFPNGAVPLSILGNSGNTQGIVINSRSTGAVVIQHNDSTKFETTGLGITVYGVTDTQQLNVASVADKTTIFDGNNITLSYNTGGGNVAICTNPSGPITLNVVGIPTTSDFDNRAISFAVIVQQGTTAYGCSSVNLNGVSFDSTYAVGTGTHISYPGGTVSVGNTSGYDVFNFTGINTVGSASTTENYKLLSNLNGDYRLWS
jgi:hypothetical protein